MEEGKGVVGERGSVEEGGGGGFGFCRDGGRCWGDDDDVGRGGFCAGEGRCGGDGDGRDGGGSCAYHYKRSRGCYGECGRY